MNTYEADYSEGFYVAVAGKEIYGIHSTAWWDGYIDGKAEIRTEIRTE